MPDILNFKDVRNVKFELNSHVQIAKLGIHCSMFYAEISPYVLIVVLCLSIVISWVNVTGPHPPPLMSLGSIFICTNVVTCQWIHLCCVWWRTFHNTCGCDFSHLCALAWFGVERTSHWGFTPRKQLRFLCNTECEGTFRGGSEMTGTTVTIRFISPSYDSNYDYSDWDRAKAKSRQICTMYVVFENRTF